ncbi:hypothetical protein BHE74_00038376 [Ensete ventricosum]|nr:hypothetical protein GW17_00016965 [Ensete ventricosum]RWW55000.1 hypothetical protein BHE74_00038376 [Ensete ventricosum]RZR98430.1 hypothetical protein BHM03_00027786 [Ensete ventricosum]
MTSPKPTSPVHSSVVAPSLVVDTSYRCCRHSCIRSPHLPHATMHPAAPSSIVVTSTTVVIVVAIFFLYQPFLVADANIIACSHVAANRHCPSYCHPCRCCHQPLLQPSSAIDIIDLESYAMASIDLISARLETFEMRMEDRLRGLFAKHRLG